jgi:hypothetical protein
MLWLTSVLSKSNCYQLASGCKSGVATCGGKHKKEEVGRVLPAGGSWAVPLDVVRRRRRSVCGNLQASMPERAASGPTWRDMITGRPIFRRLGWKQWTLDIGRLRNVPLLWLLMR